MPIHKEKKARYIYVTDSEGKFDHLLKSIQQQLLSLGCVVRNNITNKALNEVIQPEELRAAADEIIEMLKVQGIGFIFGGDPTDKGKYDLDILKFLLKLKKDSPKRVKLGDGNRSDNKIRHWELFVDEALLTNFLENNTLIDWSLDKSVSEDNPFLPLKFMQTYFVSSGKLEQNEKGDLTAEITKKIKAEWHKLSIKEKQVQYAQWMLTKTMGVTSWNDLVMDIASRQKLGGNYEDIKTNHPYVLYQAAQALFELSVPPNEYQRAQKQFNIQSQVLEKDEIGLFYEYQMASESCITVGETKFTHSHPVPQIFTVLETLNKKRKKLINDFISGCLSGKIKAEQVNEYQRSAGKNDAVDYSLPKVNVNDSDSKEIRFQSVNHFDMNQETLANVVNQFDSVQAKHWVTGHQPTVSEEPFVAKYLDDKGNERTVWALDTSMINKTSNNHNRPEFAHSPTSALVEEYEDGSTHIVVRGLVDAKDLSQGQYVADSADPFIGLRFKEENKEFSITGRKVQKNGEPGEYIFIQRIKDQSTGFMKLAERTSKSEEEVKRMAIQGLLSYANNVTYDAYKLKTSINTDITDYHASRQQKANKYSSWIFVYSAHDKLSAVEALNKGEPLTKRQVKILKDGTLGKTLVNKMNAVFGQNEKKDIDTLLKKLGYSLKKDGSYHTESALEVVDAVKAEARTNYKQQR